MVKSIRSKKYRKPQKPPDPDPTLERLLEVAQSTGLEVRRERLHREVGYSVRSGLCLLDGNEVLLVDKNANDADQIDAICRVLAKRGLGQVWVEPELRRRIDGGDDSPRDAASPPA